MYRLMHRSNFARYSITPSARASSDAGNSIPSALSACSGHSPGFSPLRMRPGVDARQMVSVDNTATIHQATGGDKSGVTVDRGYSEMGCRCTEHLIWLVHSHPKLFDNVIGSCHQRRWND